MSSQTSSFVSSSSPKVLSDQSIVEVHVPLNRPPRQLTLIDNPYTVRVNWNEPAFSDNGSFGCVFRGTLTLDGLEVGVAVKLLRITRWPETVRKLLLKEARTWEAMRHERLLEFLGTCEVDISAGDASYKHLHTHFGMVSPFMRNGNALEYLQANPLADRAAILCQVAEALAYLHGIAEQTPIMVHGDLKGENILISDDGNALLGDFGLTRLHEEVAPTMSDYSASSVRAAGTARFKSPELIFSVPTPSKTPASDVWAYGMLIYQVYSGTVPFHTLNDTSFHLHIRAGATPPRPCNCPVSIWAVAKSCWKFDPMARPSMSTILACMRVAVASSDAVLTDGRPSAWRVLSHLGTVINTRLRAILAADRTRSSVSTDKPAAFNTVGKASEGLFP